MKDLDKLALKHGTDKSSAAHHYTRLYQRYLDDLPTRGTLLELGWGGHEDPDAGGASARMWKEWLPLWQIVVVDNERKQMRPTDTGIALLHMSQTNPTITEFGPFNVIIDDASHLSSLTIESFQLLWSSLAPGGWYIVEDTHMAYHAHYYGNDEANSNPDMPGIGGQQTAMQFLKRLADEANFKGRGDMDLFPEKYWLGFDVEEVHFHFNICFIKKRL